MNNQIKCLVIKLFEQQFCRFLLVGSFVTITNIILIFGLYNLFHLGYWLSSTIGYIIVTFISYYLNKKYTFQFENDNIATVLKFFLIIALCYIFSYLMARPLTRLIFRLICKNVSIKVVEQVAMLVGMGGSIALNYVGQKVYVFK